MHDVNASPIVGSFIEKNRLDTAKKVFLDQLYATLRNQVERRLTRLLKANTVLVDELIRTTGKRITDVLESRHTDIMHIDGIGLSELISATVTEVVREKFQADRAE